MKRFLPSNPVFLVTAFFLVSILLVLGHREIYGFEARSALFARGMLEGSSLLVPHLYQRPYTDYPPLFFLLQYLFSLPSGHVSALSISAPSALAACGLIVLAWWFAKAHLGSRAGLVSALCLAGLPEFWLKAEKATLDMLLALECGIALVCFFRADGAANRKKAAVFYVAGYMAALAGLFTKGPVGLLIPLFCWFLFLAAEKRFRDIINTLPLWITVVVLGLGLEALLFLKAGGKDLLESAISSQFLSRLGGSSNKPFYFYLFYLAMSFLPWLLWLALQLLVGRNHPVEKTETAPGKGRGEKRLFTFLASWAAGVLIPFLISSSRHGRYILPAFMPIAILAGLVILNLSEKGPRKALQLVEKTLLFLLGMVLILVVALVVMDPLESGMHISALAALAIVAAALGYAGRLLDEHSRAFFLVAVVMIYSVSSLGLLLEPGISRRESGKGFTTCTESSLSAREKVVLYWIKPDKNGIKYALYSRAYPERLVFIRDIQGLSNVPRPFVLAAFKKDIEQGGFLPGKLSAFPLCTGMIHGKQVVSFRIR